MNKQSDRILFQTNLRQLPLCPHINILTVFKRIKFYQGVLQSKFKKKIVPAYLETR